MEKVPIFFNKTMTADKRNPDGCYLRKGLFASKTRGMYPAVDFRENSPADTFPNDSVLKKHINNLLFVQDGSDAKIYYSSNNAPLGPYTLAHTFTNGSFYDAVYGNDEIHAMIRIGATLKVYKIDYNASTVTEIASQGMSGSGGKALFDGIHYFYFFQDKIYRQLKSATMALVFNDTGDLPDSVDFFGEQIILFFDVNNTIKIAFWDKSDMDLFDKVVIEKNAQFLGGGNVDNTLMLIKSIGNRTNMKERNGEIVSSVFDGEKFQRINSIKAGDESLFLEQFSIGNEVMVVAINSNVNTHNTTLYQNWLLKFQKDGTIEVIDELSLSGTGEFTFVDIHYDYISYGLRGASGASPKFLHNADRYTEYKNFINFDNAEYITNFLDFTGDLHKLGGIAFTFEKLFDNDSSQEEITISYRLSERDDWTTIDTITAENVKDNMENRMSQTDKDAEYNDDTVGLTPQMYELTELPNGDAFIEYYEVQFKFESKNGFSIIDAWYYTDAIKRATRN